MISGSTSLTAARRLEGEEITWMRPSQIAALGIARTFQKSPCSAG